MIWECLYSLKKVTFFNPFQYHTSIFYQDLKHCLNFFFFFLIYSIWRKANIYLLPLKFTEQTSLFCVLSLVTCFLSLCFYFFLTFFLSLFLSLCKLFRQILNCSKVFTDFSQNHFCFSSIISAYINIWLQTCALFNSYGSVYFFQNWFMF